MNSLEKSSFYSFLCLYLGSSIVFILLSGYWYYTAQKSSLESMTYYKLQNIANNVSSLIIGAHMSGTKLTLPQMEDGYEYMLIHVNENKTYKEGYFDEDGYKVLISTGPKEHLAVKYVIVKAHNYNEELTNLEMQVLLIMGTVLVLIMIISWFLSKLFIRPIRDKMMQLEQFIQDISHELNTPITALKMSTQRAVQKQDYDEKVLRNISISTKQLYSIYQSLTYLNFSTQEQELESVNLKVVLLQSLEYYSELLIAKDIQIKSEMEDVYLHSVTSRMELLFSNLISNAIKYSMPNTTISISLSEGHFSIKDEGVGIEKEKLKDIFKLYERGSNIAGGFGVGLSIVKQICDEYDIEIELKSEVDVGSEFILEWNKKKRN